MRRFNVGVVIVALLASTALAAAQDNTGHKYHRHHATRQSASAPTAYPGNPADFQGSTTEVAGPHYGRADMAPGGNKLLPSGSDEMNKMYEWRSSR
jgi:hypothetical protein